MENITWNVISKSWPCEDGNGMTLRESDAGKQST